MRRRLRAWALTFARTSRLERLPRCWIYLQERRLEPPDPGWDFEPDQLTISKGDVLSVVDQGGEPHTFTEVKAFGNGFLPPLNPGSATSVIPRVCRRLFQARGGQDPNSSRQSSRYHGPVEGKASVPMLHPSLDADGGGREVNGGSHCEPAACRSRRNKMIRRRYSATTDQAHGD